MRANLNNGMWTNTPVMVRMFQSDCQILLEYIQTKSFAYIVHRPKIGPIIRVAPQMYSIGDPAAMKPIYGIGSPLKKSSWYDYWGDPRVPNHNLFSAIDPPFHAAMRRKMANLYTMTTIKSYEPYVNNCVRVLLEQFDRFAAKGEWFDLQHFTQCYALDVIGEITVSSLPHNNAAQLNSITDIPVSHSCSTAIDSAF